jgi:DNA-directed RNA polymerase II subunit RPB1
MSKRFLTEEEIQNILSVIPLNRGIPKDIAQGIKNNIISKMRKSLEKIEVYPELIPDLQKEIIRQYYKTQIQAGDSVGIVTAQSIGERQTQSTLNTFHSAGISVKTVIAGVPRFSELLNATQEPKAKSCFIYLNKKFKTIKDLRDSITHTFTELTLKRLSTDVKVNIMKSGVDDWYEIFSSIYNDKYKNFDSYIRFYLNTELLYEFSLTLENIADKLEGEYEDLTCVFSPDYLGILDVYTNVSEITEDKEYLTLEDCRLIYIEDDVIPQLLNTQINNGIPGIEDIYPTKKDDEWMLESEGSNLKYVLCHDMVDKVRTISNNMWEIYSVLGIEAARNFLIEEFCGVVSSDGTYVNDSHIKLLVDIMTYTGNITSISRYGLKKENCGPLAKASFEESLDNFLKAGVYGEVESIKGVSASVILGKVPKIGSGLCDLLVDVTKLPTVNEDVKEKEIPKGESNKNMKVNLVRNKDKIFSTHK